MHARIDDRHTAEQLPETIDYRSIVVASQFVTWLAGQLLKLHFRTEMYRPAGLFETGAGALPYPRTDASVAAGSLAEHGRVRLPPVAHADARPHTGDADFSARASPVAHAADPVLLSRRRCDCPSAQGGGRYGFPRSCKVSWMPSGKVTSSLFLFS